VMFMTFIIVFAAILAIIYAGTLFGFKKAYKAKETEINDE